MQPESCPECMGSITFLYAAGDPFPMRILAASDIHGDVSIAGRLAKRAEEESADLVILAGDLTLSDDLVEGILAPFVRRDLRVAILAGNHDSFATTAFLAERYKVTDLHASSLAIGDVGVFGCGGANIGLFALEEEAIERYLARAHESVKAKAHRIMVTHVHPEGSRAAGMTTIFPGSSGVRASIERLSPDIHICGHVHEAEGLEERIGETTIYNVGEQGKIIDL